MESIYSVYKFFIVRDGLNYVDDIDPKIGGVVVLNIIYPLVIAYTFLVWSILVINLTVLFGPDSFSCCD